MSFASHGIFPARREKPVLPDIPDWFVTQSPTRRDGVDIECASLSVAAVQAADICPIPGMLARRCSRDK